MGFALQCLYRILLVASCSVVPALDGRDPKLLRLPVVGCFQDVSASSLKRSCSLPGSGGAASNGPITISRSCAHRRRVGCFDVFSVGSTADLSLRIRSFGRTSAMC